MPGTERPSRPFPSDGLTDRVVVLRPWHEHDLDLVTEVISTDREISRWTRIPWPYSRDLADEWFAGQAAELEAGTALSLAITDAATGDLLGAVGLHRIGAESRPGSAFFPNEIGYWLARDARGRGACTRAVRLLVAWAFETLELEQVEVSTVVGNAASERVITRVGFVPAGEVAGLDDDARRLRRFILVRGGRTLSADE